MSQPESPYLHGTDPEEQDRLSRMNQLLNRESLEQIGVRPGEWVLDVGCGLGQLTRALARSAGRPALGVERSPEQREAARRLAAEAGEEGLVEFRAGDALPLPLGPAEAGRFDLVHARFLLEHVPDPQAVVREMVRAARPGGRIVLEDDDHSVLRLWPEPEGFVPLWEGYIELFRRLGCDPFVGRRLVALLHAAGARPARSRCLFFGGCAGDPAFPDLCRNLIRILRGAGPGLAQHGVAEPTALEAVLAALERWSRRPDAALWYGRAWAEGIRSPHAS